MNRRYKVFIYKVGREVMEYTFDDYLVAIEWLGVEINRLGGIKHAYVYEVNDLYKLVKEYDYEKKIL